MIGTDWDAPLIFMQTWEFSLFEYHTVVKRQTNHALDSVTGPEEKSLTYLYIVQYIIMYVLSGPWGNIVVYLLYSFLFTIYVGNDRFIQKTNIHHELWFTNKLLTALVWCCITGVVFWRVRWQGCQLLLWCINACLREACEEVWVQHCRRRPYRN